MKKYYFFTLIFTLIFSISYSQISTFPHTVSFESASDLGTTASDADSKWTSTTIGNVQGVTCTDAEGTFTRHTGATPSNAGAGTGPSGAIGGSFGDYYVYTETSGGTSGHNFELVARYDLRCHTNASINFVYSNHGSGSEGPALVVLYVYSETNSAWSGSAIWSSLTSPGSSWYWGGGGSNSPIDLSAYDGQEIQLWFNTTSQGYRSDFAIDYITVDATARTSSTWDGSGGSDWKTAENWSNDCVPLTTMDAVIADVSTQPIISSDDGSSGAVTLDDITINSGATLTIEKEASLTLTGNYTNNSGTVTLNSDSNEFATIKVGGTSSGNITYNRWVNSVSNGSGWDLIGSPVGGLSISSFASTNDSPLATGGGSGSNQYAIGAYDNSQSSTAAAWSNYTSDGAGSSTNISAAGNFTKGKGYQMATDSGATLAFTGTIDVDATETISVESFTDAFGYRWNLLSNPYPSYITIGPNSTTDTFLEVNDAVIDDTFVGVYGYDANTDNDGLSELFDIYNNASSAKIAPGQAFMVAARSTTAANITFKEEMQTVTGSDDFISGDVVENTEVELRIYNDDIGIGKTRLFFDEGLGMGLDRGWDAGHYYENAAIMTRLIEDDEGHGMAINAMGLDAMENAVIPLVINQSTGQEFRVNLHTATIPDPNIYLEDVEEGTFTNLYEGDFVMTPASDLEGVGRFFIHMTADTMSNEDVSTSMLNAYKEVNANYITIEGLATQSNNINVSLYNILGRKVLDTTLNNNMNTQTISTIGLSAGIYVIELESGTDRLTKKLIIQ